MANDIYDTIDLTNVNTASELCDTMETAFPELGEVNEQNGLSVKDMANTGVKVLGVAGGMYATYKLGCWVCDKVNFHPVKKIKNAIRCNKAEREAKKAAK